MDLHRIDWNLLPVLDALLLERNVSRAASRLGIAQPSASAGLGRLRRHFGDELLMRKGRTYTLTPLAERLAPLVHEAVSRTQYAFSSAAAFDPATSDREFTIAASDYAQIVVAPALHQELARRAPNTRLQLVEFDSGRFKENRDVVLETDGWIAPREMLPGYEHAGLLADRWVCVVAASNAGIRDVLTVDDLRGIEWVSPTVRGRLLGLQSDGLAALGLDPTIAVTTDTFAAVAFLVAGTTRVGLMQQRLAQSLQGTADLRILECPWPVQALHLTFWWDHRWESDGAHHWLRQLVASTMDTMH